MKNNILLLFFLLASVISFSQSVYDEAVELYNNDKYEEAIPLFKEYLSEPNNAEQIIEIEVYLSSSYLELNELDFALQWAYKVLDKDSLNRKALIVLYRIGVAEESYSSVIKYSTILIDELNYKKAYLYYYRSISFFKLGKIYLAIEDMKKVYKLYPNEASVNFSLGLYYFNYDTFEESIPYFKKSIELNHELINSYYNIGVVNYKLKNYQKAIESINKATKLNPDYLSDDSLNHKRFQILGKSHYYTEDYDSAVYYLEKIPIGGDEYYDHITEKLVFSCYQIEAYDKVIIYSEDILKKHPERSYFYPVLANTYLNYKNDTTEAINYLEKVLDLKNKNILEVNDTLDYYSKISLSLAALGDLSSALEVNTFLLEVLREMPYLYRHRRYLYFIFGEADYLDEVQGCHDQLIDLYKKRKDDEKTAFYYAQKAETYLEHKNFDKALEYIDKALEFDRLIEYQIFKTQAVITDFFYNAQKGLLENEENLNYQYDMVVEHAMNPLKKMLKDDSDNIFLNELHLKTLLFFEFMINDGNSYIDDICSVFDKLLCLKVEIDHKTKEIICDGLDEEYNYYWDWSVDVLPYYDEKFIEEYE